MLESVFIHLHETAGRCQLALGHHIWRRHRRHHVQQLIGDQLLPAAVAFVYLENRLAAGGANRFENAVVAGLNSPLGHHLPQRCGVGGHPEDARSGSGIDHLGVNSPLFE